MLTNSEGVALKDLPLPSTHWNWLTRHARLIKLTKQKTNVRASWVSHSHESADGQNLVSRTRRHDLPSADLTRTPAPFPAGRPTSVGCQVSHRSGGTHLKVTSQTQPDPLKMSTIDPEKPRLSAIPDVFSMDSVRFETPTGCSRFCTAQLQHFRSSRTL